MNQPPDKIEVLFDAAHGDLSVNGSAEQVQRVAQRIAEEFGLADRFEPAEVKSIAVFHVPMVKPKNSSILGPIAFLGCALFGFAMMFTWIIGLWQIVLWFLP